MRRCVPAAPVESGTPNDGYEVGNGSKNSVKGAFCGIEKKGLIPGAFPAFDPILWMTWPATIFLSQNLSHAGLSASPVHVSVQVLCTSQCKSCARLSASPLNVNLRTNYYTSYFYVHGAVS